MKKPSEDTLSQSSISPEQEAPAAPAGENEIYSASEGIRQTGKKTPVERDETTVHDELDDYKFLKSRSIKRSEHSSHHSSGSDHHHHHHHRRRRRRKKMKTWKKVLLIVVSVILALTLILTGTIIFLVSRGYYELFDVELRIDVPQTVSAQVQDNGDSIVYEGKTYRYNRDVTNLLFMGVDKRSLDDENEEGTGGQADVIVMIAINIKSHKLTLFAIPRDTMAEISLYTPSGTYNGMATKQICLAFAYGDGKETSCENTVSSVSKLFYNIPIKTYYALDLDGIAAMNDAVGGVDVVSPETIGDFTQGESYHLEGREAENFVRVRDKSKVESSMDRLKRQEVYAQSFLNKLQASLKSNPTSAVTLFNESAPYSSTNLTAAKVAYLAKELMFGGGMSPEIITVSGETTLNGKNAEYKVNDKEFFKQFLNVYYE